MTAATSERNRKCFPPTISFVFLSIAVILVSVRSYRVFLKFRARRSDLAHHYSFMQIGPLSIFVMCFWIFQDIPVEYLECKVSCSFLNGIMEKMDILSYFSANFLNFYLMYKKFKLISFGKKILAPPGSNMLLFFFRFLIMLYIGLTFLLAFICTEVDVEKVGDGIACEVNIEFSCSISMLLLDLVITVIGLYLFLTPVLTTLYVRYAIFPNELAQVNVQVKQKRKYSSPFSVAGEKNEEKCNPEQSMSKLKTAKLIRNDFSREDKQLFWLIVWDLVGVLVGQFSSYVLTMVLSFDHGGARSMEAIGPFLNVLGISFMFQDHVQLIRKVNSHFHTSPNYKVSVGG